MAGWKCQVVLKFLGLSASLATIPAGAVAAAADNTNNNDNNRHGRRQEIEDTYDYVIIGGGTAGLTVGDRLSENGKCKLTVSSSYHSLLKRERAPSFNRPLTDDEIKKQKTRS